VPPKASTEEIKKSFRRLAHEFHPDKNPSNVFAEARFREIHEAYTILSNEEKRAVYDYERWLSGRFTKNTIVLTPEYLLQEVHKLNAHIAEVDVYRMNKELLHRYLLFLLANEKVAILRRKANPETLAALIKALMQSAAVLPYYFAIEVLQRLKVVAEEGSEPAQEIGNALKRLMREAQWQRLFPWLALLITLLLCVAMFFFSKK
jgi:DnaJ-domain-containing protein 1